MRLPNWLLKLLPMWDYICPRCRGEVKANSHQCPSCGERFTFPLKVPPRCLKSKEELERYVHEKVFPRVSAWQREYLAQFFTIIFQDGFESGDYSAWSSTTVSGNGTLTINSSIVHHGVYSSKSSWSAGGDLAYATKTFANTSVLYVREYVLLQDLPQTGTLTRFLTIRAGTTEMGMIGLERSSAGVLRWTIRYRNNGDSNHHIHGVPAECGTMVLC
jgi:hypothetical protein